MIAREYRQLAYSKISEQKKWGTLALITLIYSLILGAAQWLGVEIGSKIIFIGSFLSIASVILTGPFNLSIAKISLDTVENRPSKVEDVFYGFNDFIRSLLAHILNLIFIFLWSLLLIIPGIIKALSYSMTFYIMEEDKKIDFNDARKKSMEIMDGNKGRLCCLHLSFIGWYILSILTLGILSFWVIPYHNVAVAEFYNSIRKKKFVPIINADEIFE